MFSILKLAIRALKSRNANEAPSDNEQSRRDEQQLELVQLSNEQVAEVLAKVRPQESHPNVSKTNKANAVNMRSFTNVQLDIIEQIDGSWIARCQNWGVTAVGETDAKAILSLWNYLRSNSLIG